MIHTKTITIILAIAAIGTIGIETGIQSAQAQFCFDFGHDGDDAGHGQSCPHDLPGDIHSGKF